MYEFLFLMAPAALSVLVMNYLIKKKPSAVIALLEWFAFGILDNVCILVLMIPFGKVMLIFSEDGSMHIQFGTVAVIFAIVLAVIVGVVFAFVAKNFQVKVKTDDRELEEIVND